MHDVRDLGIREVVRRAIAAVGPGPAYLTVDVDVLDPAFIPGTGTPEPGGMTATDLLLAVRTVAGELELVGFDVVEVIPTGIGTADSAALVAERVVREALTGSPCGAVRACRPVDGRTLRRIGPRIRGNTSYSVGSVAPGSIHGRSGRVSCSWTDP